jgi:NAD(P)-dependent dehydrogenase (short-subunit alcohol dehydrogenase family)
MAKARPRVARVTGAGKGIGRAIAHKLLADGWRLGLVDLKEADLAHKFGRKSKEIVLAAGDVADARTAERAVKETVGRFGGLDGLVSNAGIMIRKPIGKLTVEEWRRVLDTNVTATFLFARAAERCLRAGKGAVVTIASTRALMSEANTESYSASKGGLVALTRALDQPRAGRARELRQPGLDQDDGL